MDLKNHFLLTFAALFFLSLIITKPGFSFLPAMEGRDCKLVKGKVDCSYKSQEYKINHSLSAVSYKTSDNLK